MPKRMHIFTPLGLIRTRLTLWVVAILAAGLLAFVLMTFFMAQALLQRQSQARLRQDVTALSVVLAQEPNASLSSIHAIVSAYSADDVYVQYQSPAGVPIASSANVGHSVLPLSQLRAAMATDQVITLPFQNASHLMYAHSVVIDDRVVGYVIASQTTTDHNEMRMVLAPLYTGGGILVLLVVLFVWCLIRWMLRPLEQLANSASHIAKVSDHAMRLHPPRRSDEITSLAHTINGMLDSLEGAYRKVQDVNDVQRQFLADVSHELRTPLTIMLSSLDLMKRERGGDAEFQANAWEDIQVEAGRMARLVTRLLLLARTDATATFAREPLLIVDVIREVYQQWHAPTRDVEVYHQELVMLDDAVVMGNADYLKQVLLILLENACKYTPSGGKVTIREELCEQHVNILIIDTGIGIAAEDISTIFQRFYRAPNARTHPGLGLGLSIAKSVVDQHNGTIRVESIVGQGSSFCISLPLVNM